MPPNSQFAKYKQNIRNYLWFKHKWNRTDAIVWLNANEDFVRKMMATEASFKQTANAIAEMESKLNAE